MGPSFEEVSVRDRRVLVVDDDPVQRHAMAGYLAQHDLSVATAHDARSMDAVLALGVVDVLLLDVLMPPGEDGLSICRRISARPDAPPVILMHEAADDVDRIVGLELGADDYLAKPCSLRELLARVRAVMRRGGPTAPARPSLAAVFAGWRLDLRTCELRDPDGARVDMPNAELSLLRALIERPHRVLSREQLIDYALRDGVSASDRAIDTRICRLRKALSRAGLDLIRTVRNEGYAFRAKVALEG